MIEREIIKQILLEKNAMRNSEIFNADLAKQSVLQNKEYAELDKKSRALVFEIGKLKFEQKSVADVEKELENIENQKKLVLKKLKISEKSLVPHFNCKKCEDTGYFNGKLCSCVKQTYNELIMRESNIDFDDIPLLADYNYDCFADKDSIKQVKDNLLQFVNDFEQTKKQILIFAGKTGVGKSYIAKSVAKSVIKNGHTALFCSMFALNNHFLKIHTSSSETKMLELEQYTKPDLLIIDDLGTEPMLKNVTKEYLLLLLNDRIFNNKKTIITTNLMPDNIIDRYEERIFSRLFDKSKSVCIKFEGKDLRLAKN